MITGEMANYAGGKQVTHILFSRGQVGGQTIWIPLCKSRRQRLMIPSGKPVTCKACLKKYEQTKCT